MGSLKKVRPELSPAQVEQAVLHSSGEDWLYFQRERVYSFRRDLLIRIEQVSPEVWRLFYGAAPIGDAAIEEHHHGNDVVDATLRGQDGKIFVALSGVPIVRQTVEEEPVGAIGSHSACRTARSF